MIFGPFHIPNSIGKVAYELDVPHHYHISHIFCSVCHISCLKKKQAQHISPL